MTLKTLSKIGFLVLTLGLFLLNIDLSSIEAVGDPQSYHSAVIESEETGESTQSLEVKMESGDVLQLENDISASVNGIEYKAGDKVIVSEYTDPAGNTFFNVIDHNRRGGLIAMAALFAMILLVVNRKHGAYALLSMGFSFLVLFKLILPLILLGHNPVWMALLGALFIVPVSFYVSHGINKKTSIAMLGTLCALLITGLLSSAVSGWAHLSGLSSEAAGFLKVGAGSLIDFEGLLLAGIIIGLLGILDDVCVTQSSVVKQLKKTHPKLGFHELFKRSMHVGRDHISSLVNTLVLVYTGAAMPLMLLFLDASQSVEDIVNFEIVAEEIIRMLLGSTGLVLAVPITSLIAAYAFSCQTTRSQ